MASNGGMGKPLGGEAGYKRLARLVARAFYLGECPPREAAEGGGTPAADADAPSTSRAPRQFHKVCARVGACAQRPCDPQQAQEQAAPEATRSSAHLRSSRRAPPGRRPPRLSPPRLPPSTTTAAWGCCA